MDADGSFACLAITQQRLQLADREAVNSGVRVGNKYLFHTCSYQSVQPVT